MSRRSLPVLSRFELAALISCRAQQIEEGSPSTLGAGASPDMSPFSTAIAELRSGRLPLVVQRTMPDGRVEVWRTAELHIPSRLLDNLTWLDQHQAGWDAPQGDAGGDSGGDEEAAGESETGDGAAGESEPAESEPAESEPAESEPAESEPGEGAGDGAGESETAESEPGEGAGDGDGESETGEGESGEGAGEGEGDAKTGDGAGGEGAGGEGDESGEGAGDAEPKEAPRASRAKAGAARPRRGKAEKAR